MINMTYEYRIEPTPKQAQVMTQWLEICRGVYNFALAARRDWIRSRKCPINACSLRQEYIMTPDTPRPTYGSQCKDLTTAKKRYRELTIPYSQVLQQVLATLEKGFVSMWEQGHGFPRFKKPGRMRSFLFPQFAESPVIGDTLNLPKLGEIKMQLHRPIPDGFAIKQVRVLKRASGWCAMLSLQADINVPDTPASGYPIGIDVGLEHFLATSEGLLIANPRFFIEAQRKLESLNRAVSKKQKGSNNQRKARQKVARLYERINNARKDFHFKLAHRLCDDAGMIFAENLNLKGLAKGMLGKHTLDAGWGRFLNLLGWVCWKRGVYFARVNANGTSGTCPECDAWVLKELSVRVHHCPECGYTTNRDVAAAQVIRERGCEAVGHMVKQSVEDSDAGEYVVHGSLGRPMKQKLSKAILGSPHCNL